jgi:hypothetical protein
MAADVAEGIEKRYEVRSTNKQFALRTSYFVLRTSYLFSPYLCLPKFQPYGGVRVKIEFYGKYCGHKSWNDY